MRYSCTKSGEVFVDFSKAHVLGRLGYHTEEIIIVAETTDRIFQQLYSTRNVSASSHVGRLLGTRLQYAGITNVQLDLQGKKYHGKTKAFVDGIHEMGIITTENTKKIAAIHKLADKAK
ncbi:50S ribosomal protein L18p/L5e [Sphaeroforma arctica JP610]|uniref:50S ribosomal protein L18p/L5e n=1 Tax=Sphaeroforma arctica JP610 TaxID=667725 RepID=A0A0L0FDI2_9EUKA|nr:50S ribosomal protein L18p/L5e [Sphaeroforma arctica JP610]KNC74098.1 50S ribosomal protein L18p/L5e [Sphaeroforma arctica JP610]|eukprot:XP_014148000.1 50S ribosomal protein L18p/L5e [Sphaeroforma arctica JP610]